MGLLGWLGFFLLVGTLMPFLLRRFGLWKIGEVFFSRQHPLLAISCIAALTLHGLWGLLGRHGWGAGLHLGYSAFSGVLAWLALLGVILLALYSLGRKPFPRTHCWLVAVLVILTFNHLL